MSSTFLSSEEQSFNDQNALQDGAALARLLDPSRNVGDLLKLDYGEATILVHDYLRKEVGGVPLGCFLLASRIEPGSQPNPLEEDTSLVLLRVLSPASLPNAMETEMIRFNIGQRVAQENHTWDHPERTDQYTLHQLRYSGLKCRVLGTFLLRENNQGRFDLRFGADLANFYSGQGMKVYKPDGEALQKIVNFVRPYGVDANPLAGRRINIGRVRYAASEREGDTTGQVIVDMEPTDLLSRRTALFGMSRTGKSNTTKVIASSVFKLRERDNCRGRVGQLILDPNGEYANENVQDRGSLRNVWRGTENSNENDVVTYGLHPHPRDPNRRLVKLNFLGSEPANWRDREAVQAALQPLIQGKEIIDGVLAQEKAKYITAFKNVSFELPVEWDDSARTKYQRIISAYRAILISAGFTPAVSMQRANLTRLTNDDLRNTFLNNSEYQRISIIFNNGQVSWDEAKEAFALLGNAIDNDAISGYKAFNTGYQAGHEGKDWHDANLMGILALLEHRGGIRLLGQAASQHSAETTNDYADSIVADLRAGKLVIVDQSTGDPDMNSAAAERLMWKVFNTQKADFINPQIRETDNSLVEPPEILIYIEEAHNLLPAKNADLKNVWSRTAKEGSKYHIGLLYATQEPSSIQSNILKNTDNWFVAHLNNASEVRELKDFYDFEDFKQQILNVPEPGFIRMRTLSNPYIVPVQISRYIAEV